MDYFRKLLRRFTHLGLVQCQPPAAARYLAHTWVHMAIFPHDPIPGHPAMGLYANPPWSSVDLLDQSDSTTLHCCSAEQTPQGLWVLVLHQKARNVLLTAHVFRGVHRPSGCNLRTILGSQDVLPKHTYMVGAPHMGACT